MPKTRDLALDMAARAGLKLNEREQAILLEPPYALEMATAYARTAPFEEPALVFRFPS